MWQLLIDPFRVWLLLAIGVILATLLGRRFGLWPLLSVFGLVWLALILTDGMLIPLVTYNSPTDVFSTLAPGATMDVVLVLIPIILLRRRTSPRKTIVWGLSVATFVAFALPALAVYLSLSVPLTTDYVYFELTDPRAQVTEYGEPPVQGYSGDSIPLTYHIQTDEHALTVSVWRESFVPSLLVSAREELTTVQGGPCAFSSQLRDGSFAITWSYWRDSESCIEVGDERQLVITLGDPATEIALSGRVRQEGTFQYYDSL